MGQKGIASIAIVIILVILVGGIGTATFLVQKQTKVTSKAAYQPFETGGALEDTKQVPDKDSVEVKQKPGLKFLSALEMLKARMMRQSPTPAPTPSPSPVATATTAPVATSAPAFTSTPTAAPATPTPAPVSNANQTAASTPSPSPAPTSSAGTSPSPTTTGPISISTTNVVGTLKRLGGDNPYIFGSGFTISSSETPMVWDLVENTQSLGVGFYESSGAVYAGEFQSVRIYINQYKYPNGTYSGSYKLLYKKNSDIGSFNQGPTINYTIILTD